jgi:hypothetical protein
LYRECCLDFALSLSCLTLPLGPRYGVLGVIYPSFSLIIHIHHHPSRGLTPFRRSATHQPANFRGQPSVASSPAPTIRTRNSVPYLLRTDQANPKDPRPRALPEAGRVVSLLTYMYAGVQSMRGQQYQLLRNGQNQASSSSAYPIANDLCHNLAAFLRTTLPCFNMMLNA